MTIREKIAENKHLSIEIIKCKNCHYHTEMIGKTTITKCECTQSTVKNSWACKYFRPMRGLDVHS